jgi:PAS domain S-box-containing protein
LYWGGLIGFFGALAFGALNIIVLGYAPSWTYGTLGAGGGDLAIPTLLAIGGACGGLVMLARSRCSLGTARLAMAGVVTLSVGTVAYDGALRAGQISDYVGLIYLVGVAAVPYRPGQTLGLGLGLCGVIGSIGIPNPVVGNIGNGLPSIYSQLTFVGITAVLLTGVSTVLYLRHWVRVRSQEALIESQQRFRGVFEEAGLGIALANEEGVVIEANPALEAMLDTEEDGLRGRDFRDLTPPDDLERELPRFNALIRGDIEKYQLEKRFVRDDDSSFWAHLTVTLRNGPHGPQIIGLVENIDDKKTRKERLRLFRKAVEQAHEAVAISEGEPVEDPGPPIQYVNPAFSTMTGYEADEVIGRSPRFLRGPRTEPWVLRRLQERLQEGQSFEGEAVNYRKDGTPFINHWSSAPVRNDQGDITHWVSVQRDVTDQRQMDRRLLEVQDEERRRIDQEIHDEMGGLLASLQLAVNRVRLAADEPPPEPLKQTTALVDELSNVTRSISRRLYPGELDDHGLAGALSSLVRSLNERYDLTVTVDSALNAEDRFPSLVEVTAYRVVHEALTNAARHAQTDTARVRVRTHERRLQLEIADDGRGFDPAEQDEETYGLAGMRERVDRLNGNLEIRTAPGEGTQIYAMLPLTLSLPAS